MSEVITAVYENGVLRPLNPVNLTEGEKVQLRVLPPVPEPTNEHGDRSAVSEEELRERADRLGKIPGKPLSEIIIESRGPW